ncbi:MAG: NAD-dependent protein deacylase [Eubacteriales bacterium]|nr:NAD-dependent protein deacylase [Eubacteriales bacterium]
MTTGKIRQLQQLIDQAARIVFFGGAGVSTESGLPDFRGTKGLFSEASESPEKLLTYDYFLSHPDEFYQFHKTHLVFPDARPNPAHLKLSDLEQSGKSVAIVTQNIDGLHQMAGSQTVIELHGGNAFYCQNCHQPYSLEFYLSHEKSPRCIACGDLVRPDIVFYGEMLDITKMDQAAELILQADLLIVAGTSLLVYPAASLIHYFRGHALVIINKEETNWDDRAALVIREPVGQVFAQIKVRPQRPATSSEE